MGRSGGTKKWRICIEAKRTILSELTFSKIAKNSGKI